MAGIVPALLVATLTSFNVGAPNTTQTSSAFINDSNDCYSTMKVYSKHYGFDNYLTTLSKSEIKGKKNLVTLVITCEPIRGQ